MSSREQICQQTARKLAASTARLPSIKAAIGLDGFVDEIIAVVDKRHDFQTYDPIRTIAQLGGKITQAAGQSSNYELVVKQMKLGGNGPIMANAMAAAGLAVTYFGSVGHPSIHPVFQEIAQRARVISIGEPGHTDALEFDDGKLMLGKVTTMNDITWDNLVRRLGGEDKLKSLLTESTLVAMVNWTMIPYMSDIWQNLIDRGLPNRNGQTSANSVESPRTLFIDLADPEKRNHDDIRRATQLIAKFQDQVDVTLGLNLKEAGEIAEVLGIAITGDPEAQMESTARAIRQKLNVACVVVHPRKGAAAATKDGSASFAGPFVQQPKISTGAGDHFNAGFCLGRVLGFSLEECLCTGVGTSGYYVRSGQSPTSKQLADFVAQLPPPQ